jgi:hypothetical protein
VDNQELREVEMLFNLLRIICCGNIAAVLGNYKSNCRVSGVAFLFSSNIVPRIYNFMATLS